MPQISIRCEQRSLLYYKQIVRILDFCDHYSELDLTEVAQSLIDELDQLYLPAFVEEVRLLADLLPDPSTGTSLECLFSSVDLPKWCERVAAKYGFLQASAERIVGGTLSAIAEVYKRYVHLLNSREEKFFASSELRSIHPLSDSDRHNHGRQVFLLRTSSGEDIVYKPTSTWGDKALQRAAALCGLVDLADCFLKSVNFSDDGGDYSFVEFAEHRPCRTHQDVQRFYRRMGQLIGLSQAFHCIDLHCGNIVASADKPFIVDAECHFQNSSLSPDFRFDINTTLLVQQLPDAEWNEHWVSGLCANGRYSYDVIAPQAINDNLSTITLALGEHVAAQTSNIPMLNDEYVNPNDYCEDICQSYEQAAYQLQQSHAKIQADGEFWSLLAKSKIRVILRRTFAYYQGYRRLTMPDVATSQESAEAMMQEYAERFSVSSSEIRQLLQGDFPYFYTQLNTASVFDIYGEEVMAFPATLHEAISKSLHSFEQIDAQQGVQSIRTCLVIGEKIDHGELLVLHE